MNYGLPYMGSKNSIAEWVVSHFPKRENFYDLFCGGGAITHCALIQRIFKNYYMNDINATMVNGFIDCVNGKYKNENRWISREDFNRLRGTGDLYVDMCFSFGNKGTTYFCNKETENFKKAAHYAIFFDDYSLMLQYGLDYSELKSIIGIHNKRKHIKKILQLYSEKGITQKVGSHYSFNGMLNIDQLQSLERLEGLQRLQSLGRLEGLQRLQSLEIKISTLSYDEIEIKTNSLIYCDIPYFNTAKYNDNTFDHDKFYDWCERQNELVIISEYWMPDDRFVCVDMKEKRNLLSATSNSKKNIEKLFVPKHQFDLYNENKRTLF